MSFDTKDSVGEKVMDWVIRYIFPWVALVLFLVATILSGFMVILLILNLLKMWNLG